MKNLSPRMERFKDAGLLGCFNGTGVNSENYKEALMSDWISVKDHFPKEGDTVLAYGIMVSGEEYGYVIGSVVYKQKYPLPYPYNIPDWLYEVSGCNCCEESLRDVTHWMPLPTAPSHNP